MTIRTASCGAILCFWLAAVVTGCATSHNGIPDDEDGGGGGGDGGVFTPPDLHFDPDAFWAKDPPPMYCGVDGGPPPMVPGGTPDCPDDKNRQGCPCKKPGETAPCWPGLRKNRNLGQCKDGVTTCGGDEILHTWGPCVGYVLPVEGGAGKAACGCFSAGQWKLDNLSPCFYNDGKAGAASTVINNGKIECYSQSPPLKVPPTPWSPNTVNVDCAGRFKLCYALKAGKADMPQPGDCELVKVCVEADYRTVDQPQTFPPLPAWKADSASQISCAQAFIATGGYGEMSVDGTSVLCDKVGPKVFNRVQYCPLKCNDPANKDLPECKNCRPDGSGGF